MAVGLSADLRYCLIGQGGRRISVFWRSAESRLAQDGSSERGMLRKMERLRWMFWCVTVRFLRSFLRSFDSE